MVEIGGKAAWDEGFEAAQLDYSGKSRYIPDADVPQAGCLLCYRMIGWTIR
jgi:hypothetical protein